MDYVYLVDLNSFLTDDEIKSTDFCNCVVSNKNIAAISNDCYTYILPLEKPNELIPVSSSNSPCIQLNWSDDGKYLLCLYKNGLVNIYNIKTVSLDSIEHAYSTQLNSNDVLAIKSFSKTPKLCFSFEKRDSINYFDKFYPKSFNILQNYSKISHNGFLMLTKSGTIHVVLTDYNSVKNQIEKFEFDMNLDGQLNGMNTEGECVKFDLGDFSFEEDGSINVILTSQDPMVPIYLFKVNIKFSHDGSIIEGSSELLTTYNLQIDQTCFKTNSIFSSHETAKNIFVSLRSEQTNSDFIQIYKPSVLNQNLIGSYDINDQCILVNTIQCPSTLTQLSAPKNYTLLKELLDNRFLTDAVYIVASYQNGTHGFIDIQTFNQLTSEFMPLKPQTYQSYELYTDCSRGKKIKFPQEYLVRVDQTYTGLIGVGLTNFSRLVTFRQPFCKDSNLNQQIVMNHLFNLYEYSISSGHDFWDLLVSTNPKFVDGIIEKLEDKFNNHLQPTLQKFYFSRHYALMFSLYKQSYSYNNFRSQDTLTKLIVNRLMSIISFSIQFNLNLDQVKNLLNSNGNSLSVSQIGSNLDTINQINTMFNNPVLNQIQFKSNLYEYLSDLLKVRSDPKFNMNDLKQLSLNEIVSSVTMRKNYQLVVNQQLKHVLQSIIDIALYLTSVVQLSKFNQSSNNFGLSLLNDLWFLNEIRKAIVFVKLLVVYSSQSPVSSLLANSLPVLPLRSSVQKDLLSELFKLYSKFIYKIIEGGTINDESIMDACLNIQAETIIRPMDELFFNLKHTWLGNISTLWSSTQQFSVEHLFDKEKTKQMYPLFDIVRLIQFSRSSVTKQCIRCGNYTESGSAQSSQTKINCIYLQDSASDKCLCGGYWVLSPLK